MICVFYFRVVTSKVAKLKRAGQVNRGRVARAQENARTKNKREENETVETALNAFRRSLRFKKKIYKSLV